MKTPFYLFLVTALLISGACKVSSLAPDRQTVLYQTIARLPQLEKVSALFLVDTIQRSGKNGLQLTVRITNSGNESVTIDNILKSFSPQLYRSTLPVMIPYDPPIAVKYRGPFVNSSFTNIGAFNNGIKSELNYEMKTITLPAGGNYEVKIGINRMLSPGGSPPNSSVQTIVLQPGRYTVSASLGIIQEGGSKWYKLNPLSIRYDE